MGGAGTLSAVESSGSIACLFSVILDLEGCSEDLGRALRPRLAALT